MYLIETIWFAHQVIYWASYVWETSFEKKNQGVMFPQILKYEYKLWIFQMKNMVWNQKNEVSCSDAVIITVPEVAKSRYFWLKFNA